MRIGANYGIRNVGLLAMRFLRIERFIPFWGDELNADSNPFEVNPIFVNQFIISCVFAWNVKYNFLRSNIIYSHADINIY